MGAKRCPFFHCNNVKKNGLRNGLQRYLCRGCGTSWQSKSRPTRRLNKLWCEYAYEGASVKVLARRYGLSSSCIRSQLTEYSPPKIIQKPRTVAVIMDATYFGTWGLLVVIDPYADAANGENTVIYYARLRGTERTSDYATATDTIEAMGYHIIMATIDGRRGVKEMLESRGIPVQYCQFHQIAAVRRYLTSNPRLDPNKALKAIVATLSRTSELELQDALASWYEAYGDWLKEKDLVTKRWSHERTRKAYFSVCRNLPNLFTYQDDYMQEYAIETGKKLANTTSPLDGIFGTWKDRLLPHRGASDRLTFTMLRSFFSRTTDQGRHQN
jgi:hypothetical protein